MKKETKKPITKGMLLGDVVTEYPETAQVMIKHGLHCIGCRVAFTETVEQGAAVHGMGKKELEKMLKEMNDAISKVKNKE
jgi:hybrid cluster-associated redox disulfide protein